MLHNLSCCETRFRLLCHWYLLHSSLNLVFRQHKLHNIFQNGVLILFSINRSLDLQYWGTFLRSPGWVLGNGLVVRDQGSNGWHNHFFLTGLKLHSIQTLKVEWTAKPRLLWLWENWPRKASNSIKNTRENYVAKRRLFEPVYYRIKAKYKLIVTLEYITVQVEWMIEWMELATCDCAAANFQASCISSLSPELTLH